VGRENNQTVAILYGGKQGERETDRKAYFRIMDMANHKPLKLILRLLGFLWVCTADDKQ